MIFLDTETYSATPLKHGVYRYAEDCEVMVLTYAINEGPVFVIDLTEPGGRNVAYGALETALANGHDFVAHQANFDRTAIRLSKNLGFAIPITRWRCTMAQALAHGLPGALEKLGTILKIPMDKQKLKTGKALIQLFCKPNKDGTRNTRLTHPREWADFLEYAEYDIHSLREIHRALPTWNYKDAELANWHLDQAINDRGMCVDTVLAEAAVATIGREQARLAARTQALTDGALDSTTQRDALLALLLASHGVDLPNMQKDTVERRLLDEDLPDAVKELLAIRLQASSTSPTKYKALLRAVSKDGRLRGTIQWCGAARTGRSAGRVFQPTNLMRTPKHIKAVYDETIDAIRSGAIDLI